MAVSANHEVLRSFQNNVDDIRNLASCKICLRPFYEPFILNCGHTFCYGCLRNWVCGGETRKKKKSCPECRATIREQPAPNYALRDLAHIFTDRAELLPVDETLEEHARGKVEESQLLADDRIGPGLFNNVFKRHQVFGRMPRSIWDSSDGVQRCPLCNWELEEGLCYHCGHDALEDSSDEDISEDDIDDDDDDDDENSLSNESDITIDIPDESFATDHDEEEMLALHGVFAPTDESDTNTDTDPYPWGYRNPDHIPNGYNEFDDEDDEDEDDNWEDYSEGMDDFIDDGPYHGYEYRDDVDRTTNVLDTSSDRSNRSEDGYSINMADEGMSTSATDDDDDDDEDNSTVNGIYHHNHAADDDDDDEDDSDEDRSSTPVLHPTTRRRGHVIVSDDDDHHDDNDGDEDEDEDNDEDQFEDAVTGHEDPAQQNPSRPSFSDHIRISSHYGRREDSNQEDDDDDDEPVQSARGIRGRSRQSAVHTARRGRAFASRSQRGGTSRTTINHGYHPYSRPDDSTQSSSRYKNPDSNPRGSSRATFVF